ncbi:MAG: hypothetical protein Kow0088_21290 [Anaerolineales bacterium]
MNTRPNPKLAAIRIGDALKYDTSVNQIDRIASGTFRFGREDFPSKGITSVRAQHIYDWLMSLFKQQISDTEKIESLEKFLLGITPPSKREDIHKILQECGIPSALGSESEDEKNFDSHGFHAEVVRHARPLFIKGHYFHAVFEATKAFNALVKQESGIMDLDGQPLMNKVFSTQSPIIKVSPCTTDTEKNIQDGYRSLAVGLMAAIRNPTAHEPALSFPIGREECLEVLSLVSYLFRCLEKAATQKE